MNSLKTKVLLWFSTVIFIILTVFSITFWFFLTASIDNGIKSNLQSEADEYLNLFLLDSKIIPNHHKSVEIIIFKDGVILWETNHFHVKNFLNFLNPEKPFSICENEDDITMDASYLMQKNRYKILVYKKNIYNKMENVEDTLMTLDICLFLCLIYIVSRSIDKVLLPIRKLNQNIEQISIDNFSTTLQEDNINDEFKGLVHSFNKMISRLKDGVGALDRFNEDLSHELKTPITVIKGEVELTLSHPRKADEYVKILNTIFYEAEQIQQIIENLLLLTKYTHENVNASFIVCNLEEIVLSVIDRFILYANTKKINLVLEKIEPVRISSNNFILSSIFSNLIDNAIKYTPNHKNIYISLYITDKVYFVIEDEGIGMQEDEILKITNRFYRANHSRSSDIKGFGLGLSIVNKYLQLLNAKIDVKSKLHQGTLVTITFN